MKKLFIIALIAIVGITVITSCDSDDNWNDYKEWRQTNDAWYKEQLARTNADGTPYFTKLQPAWYPQSGVLIHYFNDHSATTGNLSPILTSSVKVRYIGRLYNDVGFDSSMVNTDGTATFQMTSLVTGWKVALTDMHVGDTCEVIVPYAEGYGVSGTTGINPYSALKFYIRLLDIPYYELQPES